MSILPGIHREKTNPVAREAAVGRELMKMQREVEDTYAKRGRRWYAVSAVVDGAVTAGLAAFSLWVGDLMTQGFTQFQALPGDGWPFVFGGMAVVAAVNTYKAIKGVKNPRISIAREMLPPLKKNLKEARESLESMDGFMLEVQPAAELLEPDTAKKNVDYYQAKQKAYEEASAKVEAGSRLMAMLQPKRT